jgi:ribosomal protein L28
VAQPYVEIAILVPSVDRRATLALSARSIKTIDERGAVAEVLARGRNV